MLDTSFFIAYIENASYIGIFFIVAIAGFIIPIPEEIMLLLIGYLAATGINNIWLALLVSYISVLFSDYLVYIASRWGSSFLQRFQHHLNKNQLRYYQERMRNHAGKTIFVLRFAVGFRFLTMFIAGSLKVPAWKFIFYDSLALLIYVPTLLFLGYHFHNKINSVITNISIASHIISISILVGGSVIATYFLRRHFNKNTQP